MAVSLNSKGSGKSIAVDLDGTLAEYDGWKGIEDIGMPYDGARKFVRTLRERGYKVIIHTCRINPKNSSGDVDALNVVSRWLNTHGIEVDEIWTGQGKPIASAYVDDKAVVCTPHMMGEAGYSMAIEAIDGRSKI